MPLKNERGKGAGLKAAKAVRRILQVSVKVQDCLSGWGTLEGRKPASPGPSTW